jgi:hypothetical protein
MTKINRPRISIRNSCFIDIGSVTLVLLHADRPTDEQLAALWSSHSFFLGRVGNKTSKEEEINFALVRDFGWFSEASKVSGM